MAALHQARILETRLAHLHMVESEHGNERRNAMHHVAPLTVGWNEAIWAKERRMESADCDEKWGKWTVGWIGWLEWHQSAWRMRKWRMNVGMEGDKGERERRRKEKADWWLADVRVWHCMMRIHLPPPHTQQSIQPHTHLIHHQITHLHAQYHHHSTNHSTTTRKKPTSFQIQYGRHSLTGEH